METKKCEGCNIILRSCNYKNYEWAKIKFCSRSCSNNKNKIIVLCKNCKKEIQISKSRLNKIVTCSSECRREYRNLDPLKYGFFKKGHTGYITKVWLGKKFTESHRNNISAGNKGKPKSADHVKKLSRENHWNWKGGKTEANHLIRKSKEYNIWRKGVYKRDYWTCRMCNIKQKSPVAHHIKGFNEYPELRFDIDNGLTLCRSCHKKVHSDIGKKTRFK